MPGGVAVFESHPGPKVKIADSLKEYRRLLTLKADQQAGRIQGLRCAPNQQSFTLVVNGFVISTYRADFVYIQRGRLVVEDCKGFRTRIYLMKKQLMLACHGITIFET